MIGEDKGEVEAAVSLSSTLGQYLVSHGGDLVIISMQKGYV